MEVKTQSQVEVMRQGGRMLAQVLGLTAASVVPDVTTLELAEIAAKELKKLGGEPAFLDYQGFPSVICVSVNDSIVHGIPGLAKLAIGDVVGLDFGVRYQGLITDAAMTVIVGEPASSKVKELVNTTEQALFAGIEKVRAGARVGDVSQAIEQVLRQANLGIIEHLVGHGVGKDLHEPPEIPNFGPAGRGPILKAGMTVAIEPMATLGSKEVFIDKDGWTVRTVDGSLAAHFEHTVLVSETGAEILTKI